MPAADPVARLAAELSEAVGAPLELERPSDPAHGDYATNAALRLAPARRQAPRELAEEIGKAAAHWEPIASFASSVGILDEIVHVFHATGLSDAHGEAEDNERIEVVRWPLGDLDGAIAATRDSKTLVGLLWLRARGVV